MEQIINILGTEYVARTDDDACMEMNADGLCKFYDKQIVVRSLEKMLGTDDSEDIKRIRMQEVVRHEIIHAFFTESGLDCYSDNEQLVSWIAVQFPKMLKVFRETNSI